MSIIETEVKIGRSFFLINSFFIQNKLIMVIALRGIDDKDWLKDGQK